MSTFAEYRDCPGCGTPVMRYAPSGRTSDPTARIEACSPGIPVCRDWLEYSTDYTPQVWTVHSPEKCAYTAGLAR